MAPHKSVISSHFRMWAATLRAPPVSPLFGASLPDAVPYRNDLRPLGMSGDDVLYPEAIASDVDTLRAAYEALNDGDISAAIDVLDLQAEWHEHSELPEASSYHGRDTIRAFLEDFLDSWRDFRQEPEDFVASGERVAIVLRIQARGKGSGVEVAARYAHLWTMRDGKGIRVDAFHDADAALEALRQPPSATASTLHRNAT